MSDIELRHVIKAAEETRQKYVDAFNKSSGMDQIIYGEIADAFEDFAVNLRQPIVIDQ